MTCEEMIYSNDYADYMINNFDEQEGADKEFQNGCVNPIIDKIAVLHMERPRDYMTNLEQTLYSFMKEHYFCNTSFMRYSFAKLEFMLGASQIPI